MLNISCSDILVSYTWDTHRNACTWDTQKCMYVFLTDFKKTSSVLFRHTDRHTEKRNQTKLTYSMVQSPWEANWFAASQASPRILWNPKVHYRTHEHLPPVPILCQPNPVHIPTSHLLEIHPNIIHPSTPRSPQWFLSLRFHHQDPIHPLSSHMPIQSHSSRFYHPHNIGWGVQIF